MRGTRGLVTGLCAVLVLLAGCGDDDDGGNTKKDAGPSAGRGGGSSGSSGSTTSGSGGSGGMTITPLGDDIAGKACTSASDCGGATCATQVPGATMILPATAPGGYCTGQCASNADCGSGGVCAGAIAGVINGQCFKSCAADADCREEYICAMGVMLGGFTVPQTCRPKPATDQLGDNVAGKPCTAAADCSGGTCQSMRGGFQGMGGMPLPGGYCTGNCTENSHCGEGGVCSGALFQGLTGNCFEECSDDGDCNREGYRCREVGQNGVMGCDVFPDPLPDNQAGKACTTDADCGGVMGTCETSLPGANFFANEVPAPDGYCSQVCATDADCGAGGVCIGAGIVNGACFKPCTAPADCRTGYTCAARGGMGTQGGDAGTSAARMVCAPMPMMTPPDEDAGSE